MNNITTVLEQLEGIDSSYTSILGHVDLENLSIWYKVYHAWLYKTSTLLGFKEIISSPAEMLYCQRDVNNKLVLMHQCLGDDYRELFTVLIDIDESFQCLYLSNLDKLSHFRQACVMFQDRSFSTYLIESGYDHRNQQTDTQVLKLCMLVEADKLAAYLKDSCGAFCSTEDINILLNTHPEEVERYSSIRMRLQDLSYTQLAELLTDAIANNAEDTELLEYAEYVKSISSVLYYEEDIESLYCELLPYQVEFCSEYSETNEPLCVNIYHIQSSELYVYEEHKNLLRERNPILYTLFERTIQCLKNSCTTQFPKDLDLENAWFVDHANKTIGSTLYSKFDYCTGGYESFENILYSFPVCFWILDILLDELVKTYPGWFNNKKGELYVQTR